MLAVWGDNSYNSARNVVLGGRKLKMDDRIYGKSLVGYNLSDEYPFFLLLWTKFICSLKMFFVLPVKYSETDFLIDYFSLHYTMSNLTKSALIGFGVTDGKGVKLCRRAHCPGRGSA